jgi:hypothetical protein
VWLEGHHVVVSPFFFSFSFFLPLMPNAKAHDCSGELPHICARTYYWILNTWCFEFTRYLLSRFKYVSRCITKKNVFRKFKTISSLKRREWKQ